MRKCPRISSSSLIDDALRIRIAFLQSWSKYRGFTSKPIIFVCLFPLIELTKNGLRIRVSYFTNATIDSPARTSAFDGATELANSDVPEFKFTWLRSVVDSPVLDESRSNTRSDVRVKDKRKRFSIAEGRFPKGSNFGIVVDDDAAGEEIS
jgi:hypothetical protein